MVVGIIGILVTLAVLVILCIKKVNIFIAALVASGVLCLFSRMNFYEQLTENFGSGVGSFVSSWIFVFFLGSVFGKLMDMTGAASAVADALLGAFGDNAAMIVLPIVICLMIYGGVSGHVVVFTIWPMMDKIFRKIDAPRYLMPAMVQFAAGTAANGGPGAPAALNLVVTGSLGVLPSAGFVIGMVFNVVVMGTGIFCFVVAVNRAKKQGKHYLAPGAEDYVAPVSDLSIKNKPNGWLSLVPLVVTVICLNLTVGGERIFPSEYAMLMGVAVLIAINIKRLHISALSNIFSECVPQAVNIAAAYGAMTGFGNIVRDTPVFQMIIDHIPDIPGSPLISLIIATNIMCALTGTATGAASVVAPILGPIYTAMGMPAETVARVICTSATAFDSVPQNAGVINYIYTFGHENYKTAYPMVFLTSVICPLIAVAVMILVAMAMGVA